MDDEAAWRGELMGVYYEAWNLAESRCDPYLLLREQEDEIDTATTEAVARHVLADPDLWRERLKIAAERKARGG